MMLLFEPLQTGKPSPFAIFQEHKAYPYDTSADETYDHVSSFDHPGIWFCVPSMLRNRSICDNKEPESSP